MTLYHHCQAAAVDLDSPSLCKFRFRRFEKNKRGYIHSYIIYLWKHFTKQQLGERNLVFLPPGSFLTTSPG